MLKMQRGASTLGLLFIVGCVVPILYFTITIALAYWDNYIVQTKLNDLKTGSNLPPETRRTLTNKMMIAGYLASRLKIERIYNIPVDDIKVSRVEDGLEVSLAYEVRKPIAGNLEVVITFSDSVVVPSEEQNTD